MEAGKSKIKVLADLDPQRGASSWLKDGHLLAVYSHGREKEKGSKFVVVVSYMGNNPILRALLS